uniref:Uncharacterized protein n=1 Tax=Ixodes ricinus TaxID=34613 RepID=A0A6B0TQL6_IXORI
MMSIWRRSLRSVFISWSGSRCIPTQQPFTKILVASAMADGAISSKFSMLHSSKNSRMGDGWEPTEM